MTIINNFLGHRKLLTLVSCDVRIQLTESVQILRCHLLYLYLIYLIETTSTVTNTDLYSIQRERNPKLKKNLRVKSISRKVDDLFGVPSCFAVSGQSAYSLPSYSTVSEFSEAKRI